MEGTGTLHSSRRPGEIRPQCQQRIEGRSNRLRVMSHETIILNQSEVLAAIDMRGALMAVEEVFRLHGRRQVQMPPKIYLDLPGGDVRAMPAYAAPLGYASIKNINMHPGNQGIPSIVGTLTLFDPPTGFPL